MSRLLALALLICIYVFAAPACLGQQAAGPSQAQDAATSGIIRGTVTDPEGAVVACASIKATSNQSGAIFTGKSDDQGKFSLADLPFGDYAVEVGAPGFTFRARGGHGGPPLQFPRDLSRTPLVV